MIAVVLSKSLQLLRIYEAKATNFADILMF